MCKWLCAQIGSMRVLVYRCICMHARHVYIVWTGYEYIFVHMCVSAFVYVYACVCMQKGHCSCVSLVVLAGESGQQPEGQGLECGCPTEPALTASSPLGAEPPPCPL